MQKIILLVSLLAVACNQVLAGDDTGTVPSTLRSVMVYRSGAELTHSATARLAQGNNELVIDDVSTTLDPASVRVTCSGSVTVLSVAFSKDFLQPQTMSPVVKKLQDSIDVLAKESGRLEVLTNSDQQLLELLNSNKNMGGTQGVTATELAKMMEYYRLQQVTIRTELAAYAEKSARIKQATDDLESQIDEEEKKNTKTSGRLSLQLMASVPGSYDFTVSYLTAAAHWEPGYDLKVTGTSDPLQLVYKATVEQSTGIDWKHVKLSLSTSLPSEGGNAPVLKAKFLRFGETVATGYGTFYNRPENSLSGAAAGMTLEKKAYQLEAVKIGGISSLEGVGDYTNVNDNTLDVVFDIDIPYDIPSNGKDQRVELKDYKLPCAYQYYAAPVADKEVYLLGQMQGWEKLNLLPAEASIMVEGTYIGRSFIDPGSTQDTLNLTLGRDKRIVVKREKVVDYNSVKFLGSDKKETLTYQITVRNNKKERARILLKDQYPVSTEKDIESEVVDAGGAAVNTETGILTWQLELAPGESRQIRVSYSIKYPKDKAVSSN